MRFRFGDLQCIAWIVDCKLQAVLGKVAAFIFFWAFAFCVKLFLHSFEQFVWICGFF